jgi:hypothetical protein
MPKPHTLNLLDEVEKLEGNFAKIKIPREAVIRVIREGLKILSIENREVAQALEQSNFKIRRRTGVSLTEAAIAVQKGIALLTRIDEQVGKPFNSLLDSRVTPQVILGLVEARQEYDMALAEHKKLSDESSNVAAEMSAAAFAKDWVDMAWGKFWIQVLVAWTDGYGQSGTKPWLVFVEEVYNIGDELPRSRTWLRRKFDEIYERCIQQPELKTLLIGPNGWLPMKPKQGRKTINAYLPSEPKDVKQWICTGHTPTGDCSFSTTPQLALIDGLNFPMDAIEFDRRRCPESLYCGGLCIPQFESQS